MSARRVRASKRPCAWVGAQAVARRAFRWTWRSVLSRRDRDRVIPRARSRRLALARSLARSGARVLPREARHPPRHQTREPAARPERERSARARALVIVVVVVVVSARRRVRGHTVLFHTHRGGVLTELSREREAPNTPLLGREAPPPLGGRRRARGWPMSRRRGADPERATAPNHTPRDRHRTQRCGVGDDER